MAKNLNFFTKLNCLFLNTKDVSRINWRNLKIGFLGANHYYTIVHWAFSYTNDGNRSRGWVWTVFEKMELETSPSFPASTTWPIQQTVYQKLQIMYIFHLEARILKCCFREVPVSNNQLSRTCFNVKLLQFGFRDYCRGLISKLKCYVHHFAMITLT